MTWLTFVALFVWIERSPAQFCWSRAPDGLRGHMCTDISPTQRQLCFIIWPHGCMMRTSASKCARAFVKCCQKAVVESSECIVRICTVERLIWTDHMTINFPSIVHFNLTNLLQRHLHMPLWHDKSKVGVDCSLDSAKCCLTGFVQSPLSH